MQAEGFRESAYLAEVEISRVIESERSTSGSINYVTERIMVPILNADGQLPFYNENMWPKVLNAANGIALDHRDKVYVRRHPNWREVGKVVLQGQVFFPGDYTIEYEGETLGSVLNRANGLTGEAYARGARLLRDGKEVFIELDKIIAGNERADIMLLPNDSLSVPKERYTVEILGHVGQPGQIKFEEGKRLSYYLGRAGDMLPESQKYVLLTQGNGATYRIKRKGLFKNNPVVEDHAIIRVLREEPKEAGERATFKEIVGETTAALTSILTIVLLVDQLNR
jgi:protein involved in polysaccharide export with SLBB domain